MVIAGGGVAGLALGIEIARSGHSVVCLEQSVSSRQRVGESLDWSAPGLLRGIGIQVDRLIESGGGTAKREVRASTTDGADLVGRPPDWVRRWPFRLEDTTLQWTGGDSTASCCLRLGRPASS